MSSRPVVRQTGRSLFRAVAFEHIGCNRNEARRRGVAGAKVHAANRVRVLLALEEEEDPKREPATSKALERVVEANYGISHDGACEELGGWVADWAWDHHTDAFLNSYAGFRRFPSAWCTAAVAHRLGVCSDESETIGTLQVLAGEVDELERAWKYLWTGSDAVIPSVACTDQALGQLQRALEAFFRSELLDSPQTSAASMFWDLVKNLTDDELDRLREMAGIRRPCA